MMISPLAICATDFTNVNRSSELDSYTHLPMQQLTRQRTRDSIFSWWSDSNPGLQGATINLHTLAKPLMRRMYDRDALKYVREHRGIPLSSEIVEIYLSYLLWKHISPSTKDNIMKDITERVKFEDDALMVAHSNILPNIRALLPSKSVEGAILALAQHPSTALAACLSFVNLLSDDDILVVHLAWTGLSRIAESSESGGDAVVEAKVLDHVRKGDDDFDVVESAWKGLERITGLSGGVEAVLDAKVLDHLHVGLSSSIARRHVQNVLFTLTRCPSIALAACSSLIHILSNDDAEAVESAWNALADIAGSSDDGAKFVVEAKALDHLPKGLLSPIATVRYSACRTVSYIAGFRSTLPAVIHALPEILAPLFTLLDDADVDQTAWRAVSEIATSPFGAEAVVKAKVLDLVPRALLSPDKDVWISACNVVERLAGHESTSPIEIRALPEFLGGFALFDNVNVIQPAWRIVSRIATTPLGAEAVVKAKVLDLVPRALLSPDIDVRLSACNVVERLAGHELTFPVVVHALPEFLGVFTLFDDVSVIQTAWRIVSRIATSPLGAEALVKANVLVLVLGALSQSPTRTTACQLLETLVGHESTMPALISALPDFLEVAFANLLDDAYGRDFGSALVVISYISQSSEGAEAAVAANIMSIISPWLLTSDPVLRERAYDLLHRLNGHDPTLSALVVRMGWPREHLSRDKYAHRKAERILVKIDTYCESLPVLSHE
ncbi:hypothetical protein MVEN_01056400 [Mycena venus]|uniref:ARM repeat-containing protein n=1 Tax=Mycena venus TaxID=2733690 RepID=A0A8H7D012_9AGAR|nr:hypothetical protein MVEN_01056400 [Mycena venus]